MEFVNMLKAFSACTYSGIALNRTESALFLEQGIVGLYPFVQNHTDWLFILLRLTYFVN